MLFSLFEWFEGTGVGTVVRQSLWLFPVIEAMHLLGLCLLGGALLVVDLRLLGMGLTDQSAEDLARAARPFLIVAVTLLVVTGGLMFLSEALKLYWNRSFWVKMTALPIALVFTFAVRTRLIRRGAADTKLKGRMLGLASIAIWFTVAAAGRWIGYS